MSINRHYLLIVERVFPHLHLFQNDIFCFSVQRKAKNLTFNLQIAQTFYHIAQELWI